MLLSFDFSWGANIGTFLYFNGKSSPSAWFMQFKQRSRLLCLFKCVSEKQFYKYDIITNEIHQAFQHNVSWRELTTINWSIHQNVLKKKKRKTSEENVSLVQWKLFECSQKCSGSMTSTFHRDFFLFFFPIFPSGYSKCQVQCCWFQGALFWGTSFSPWHRCFGWLYLYAP